MHRRAILSGSETLSQSALCASITPRYQTATFRPARARLLPGYGPRGRTRVWAAANHTATGQGGGALRPPTFFSWRLHGAAREDAINACNISEAIKEAIAHGKTQRRH